MVSEAQIQLFSGGDYTLLKDYLDSVKTYSTNFDTTFTPASTTNVFLVGPDAGEVVITGMTAGDAIIEQRSTWTAAADGAWNAPAVAGFTAGTPTASTADYDTDAFSNVLNLVEVVYASNQDPVLSAGDRVWGLLQSATGTTNASTVDLTDTTENLQITFVTGEAGSFALANLTSGTAYQLSFPKSYSLRFTPNVIKESGSSIVDTLDFAEQIARTELHLTFTTASTAATNLTLSDLDGTPTASSGAITTVGTFTADASAALMVSNANVQVYRNGVLQRKVTAAPASGEVQFSAADAIVIPAVNTPLYIAERIHIITPDAY